MKKIIALSASNNPDSINHELLRAAAGKITGACVQLISLTGISLPVYNEPFEKKEGIPYFVWQLYNAFLTADGFIIALPEHNGLPPACFKNIFDWLSRINQKMFNDKPVLLLSTSPGANGGSGSLQIIAALIPRWGGKLTGSFSLGDFNKKFDRSNNVIVDAKEEQRLTAIIHEFGNNLAGANQPVYS